MRKVITHEDLAKAWLNSLESEKIELDNLDTAMLIYDVNNNCVVVVNEHGTEFPLSDLSQTEINIFYDNIN